MPLSLRAHSAFMRLWLARVAGTGGNQMLMLALAWQMYDLTGSAWDLGLVGLMQFLPSLALALPAGQLIDRVDRSRLLSLCLASQVAVAIALWAGATSAHLTRDALLAVSVLLGALRTLQMPTQQALTPSLVPAALLPRALAFSASGTQAAVIGGPALGGALFVAGAGVTYACCAALFALSTLLVALGVQDPHAPQGLRTDTKPATSAAPGATAPGPARAARGKDMLAGLHFVIGHKVVLGAISLDLFAVLLGGATALLPMFAKDVLHVGPAGLGLLRAAPAVGALLMSAALTRWPIRRRTGPTLLGAIAFYGLCTLGFGLSTWFGVSLALLAASGAADMVSVVIRQTLVQLETPPQMRGRVNAVTSVFIGASNQLGEFESGATAAWLGPVGSVVLGGLGTCLVAALWWRHFPALSRRDELVRPEA
jgi:MFS family permease